MVSIGLGVGSYLCYPLMFLFGGFHHGPDNRAAIHFLVVLSLILLVACFATSLTGTILSGNRAQRVISVVMLLISGGHIVYGLGGLAEVFRKHYVMRYGAATRPAIQSARIEFVDPFPPGDPSEDLHSFVLTTEELAALQQIFPARLSPTDSRVCDCRTRRFSLLVQYADGTAVQGHFCYGPTQLRLFGPPPTEGSLVVPRELHDFLVAAISRRGWHVEELGER